MKKQLISKEITIPISGIGAGGDGLGAFEDQNVFVPKTCAGDVVRAVVESQNAEGIFARAMRIETPGPARRDAPCPHFERCGSCALQHIDEAEYRRWKIEKIQNTMERAGVNYESWQEPVFISPATRRRVDQAAGEMGRAPGMAGLGASTSRTRMMARERLSPTP